MISAVGLVVLLAGAGSATGQRTAEKPLRYSCQFPVSGAQQVGVTVSATFPDTGRVGQPVEPAQVSAKLTLPAASVAELAKSGAATVDGGAPLSMSVAQQGKSSDADWSALAVPSTALPAQGDLVLTATGKVPTATPSQAGEMTFTAGVLTLNLQLHKADGTAVDPALFQAPCTLAEGQDATVAKVPVADVTPEPTQTPQQPPAVNSPPADPKAAPPAPIRNPIQYPLTGTTTIKKLNAVTDLGKGAFDAWYTIDPKTFDVTIIGKLRLPPAKSSFLNFGFLPATAWMQFLPGVTNSILHQGKLTGTSIVTIRLYDAKVNGVGLDLGQRCETAKPIVIDLVSGPGFTVLGGGPVNGTFAVPPFAGCGATEPLDPLLTGLVSGPGNTTAIKLGKPCRPKMPGPDPACPWQDPDKS